MKDLEDTNKAKQNMDYANARENYQKEAWLNGVDGQPSGLQEITNQLVQFKIRNQGIEREIELKA
jgi:hypothetical protein